MEKETIDTEENNNDLTNIARRSYTYEELVGHWKFCHTMFEMVRDRNDKSSNPIERESTKFTAECIIAIMDDLQEIIDSQG